jgi:hypothetical protein
MQCGTEIANIFRSLLSPSRYKGKKYSTLKMEAAVPSETLVPIKHITQHHIPEDSNLIYCRGNLKVHVVMLVYPVLTTLSVSEVIF